MKNEIDSRYILRIFEKIRQHGKCDAGEFHLEGLKAFTDFDGYTVFIEDALVKLRFGFHNQYHFDYEDPAHFEAFDKKMKQVDSNY